VRVVTWEIVIKNDISTTNKYHNKMVLYTDEDDNSYIISDEEHAIISELSEMSLPAIMIAIAVLRQLMSNDDRTINRDDNIQIRISQQRYDTTPKQYTECCICSDEFINSQMVSVLGCGHVFHPKCITEWGHYNTVCPMCKISIPH
jgi:hypothetical protein